MVPQQSAPESELGSIGETFGRDIPTTGGNAKRISENEQGFVKRAPLKP